MYNVDERTVSDVLRIGFKSLVGKSCKRLEILAEEKSLNTERKIIVAKDLIKELSYEAMRDIKHALARFSDGTKIQVTLTKPER